VGGMPAPVLEFVTSGNLNKVRELQHELLADYKGDFSKHIYIKNTPKIPLKMHYKEDFFKLYMLDIGLFCAKAEIQQADIFAPKSDMVDDMNGALAEQFVLQELKAAGISPIFYWGRDNGTSEIDFITQANGEVVPIEVKSAKNTKSKSLKVYMQEFNPSKAIRASLKNYGYDGNLLSCPLYMIGWVFTAFPSKIGKFHRKIL